MPRQALSGSAGTPPRPDLIGRQLGPVDSSSSEMDSPFPSERRHAFGEPSMPGAEECMSCGQPAFRKGRALCGFGATQERCALYVFSDAPLDRCAEDLSGYDVSKGTVGSGQRNRCPRRS